MVNSNHIDTPERVLKGTVVIYHDDPGKTPIEKAVSILDNGALVISADGKIAWTGQQSDLPAIYKNTPVTDYGNSLIMAGFIDIHVHFPQYRILAAHGQSLLEWLEQYTFPEEAQYASKAHADAAAPIFLRQLFRHGTTGALAFSTVHEESVNALFTAASQNNMALATGKTMMNRNAPDALTHSADKCAMACQTLINKWHDKERLKYAVTPRFAITSTSDQLQHAGDLLRNNPTCLMQTHLSENTGEIAAVEGLYQNARDYTDVYQQFNLLGPQSIFAHGIHLSEREYAALSESKSAIAHCPTSNNFLGSGLFDINHSIDQKRPIRFGLATDIGAGTSYSMLTTMAEAYKVGMLNNYSLSAHEAFYRSTLANAEIMQISDTTGSLKVGKWADITVLDPYATETLRIRQEVSKDFNDLLFALMMLGDDRTVQATYVAGNCVYESEQTAA